MKKHVGFEKTLEAQEEKITTLEQLAQALLAQDHYANQQIKTRSAQVLYSVQYNFYYLNISVRFYVDNGRFIK